ncbi:hypothetical protein ACTNDG_02380 [Clostridium sp. HCP1S3_B4]|uniref:hypothetical protein n=1 Tax=unclassified Clostridium TaxID=2614128 RepID=UPI0016AE52A1|nr:hypothetical protein [Clostridiales bacterium]
MNKKIKFIISEILVCSLIGTSAICYAKTDTQEVQSSDSVSETTATPSAENNSGNTSDSSKLMLLILGVFSAAALKISSAKKALKIRK